MSFVAFVWAWEQPVENAVHQHVLLALADTAPVRETYASAAFIAGKIRRSEKTVRLALSALEGLGIITITDRPGRTPLVRLNIPADFRISVPADGDLEAGKRGRPRKTPVVSEKTPVEPENKSGNPGRKPSPSVTDEPSTEPKKEPEEEPDSSSDRFAALGGDSYGDDDETVDLRSDPEKARDAYAEAAKRLAWGRIASFGEGRRKKLEARLDEVGLEGWLLALEKAEASDFCMGREQSRDRKPFRMDFDYMVQAAFFGKLIEGRFDNRDGGLGRDGERLRQFAVAQQMLNEMGDEVGI